MCIEGNIALGTVQIKNVIEDCSSIIYRKLKDLIHKRCGLYFDENESNLNFSLKQRMQILGVDLDEYYSRLTNENEEKEFRELLNLLTIKHTYFFRNQPQFEALSQIVLPQLIRDNASSDKSSLTIWSAGCSTGQEPYSIAMVLLDTIEDIENWNVNIIGTDISKEALNLAETGIYNDSSMKYTRKDTIAKYFDLLRTSNGKVEYKIKDRVKKIARFSYLNLVEDTFPHNPDIIFCRNVMIYFDANVVKELIEKFRGCLAEDGYLFIGHSESITNSPSGFEMNIFGEGIFYHKISQTKTKLKKTRKPVFAKPKTTHEQKILFDGQKVEPMFQPKDPDSIIIRIEDYANTKNYDQALALIQKAQESNFDDPKLYYWHAFILINQNQRGRAKLLLNDIVIRKHTLFVPIYYLYGTILLQEQSSKESIKFFKKALYLDPAFILARSGLAAALKKQGKTKQALKEYENLLNEIPKDCFDHKVKYGGGFTYETIANTCWDNIRSLRVEQ